MTVYVDDMYLYPIGEYKRGNRTYKMSHCIADTRAELLAMMNICGVQARYIQLSGTYKEHFDITMSARKLAVQNGAVEITMSQLGKLIANRKATGELGKLKTEVMQ